MAVAAPPPWDRKAPHHTADPRWPPRSAIREARESERILERMTDCVLPVSRESTPDGGLVWYRYHPLLRDALLSRVGRDRRRLWTLRDRAVRWYTDARSTVSAVRCAVALGDRARAARILADSLDSLLATRSGRAVRLLRQHVGAGETARYPRLAMMVAMSLIADGLSEGADVGLSRVDAALHGIESRGLSGRVDNRRQRPGRGSLRGDARIAGVRPRSRESRDSFWPHARGTCALWPGHPAGSSHADRC